MNRLGSASAFSSRPPSTRSCASSAGPRAPSLTTYSSRCTRYVPLFPPASRPLARGLTWAPSRSQILRTSPAFAASLAVQSGFLKRLVERLERASKALVRLNLLRITKTVFDSLAAPASTSADRRRDRDKAVRILDAPVGRIARDDKAVLSRQLARSLVAEFEASRDEARRALARGSSGGSSAGGAGAALGRRASARRSVSESAAGTFPVGGSGGGRRTGGTDSPSSSSFFASRRLSRTPSTLGTSAPASAPALTSAATARRPRLDAVVDGPAPSPPARRREV